MAVALKGTVPGKGAHDKGRITEEPCEVEALMHGSEAEAGEVIPSSTVTGRGTQRRAAERGRCCDTRLRVSLLDAV